MPVSASVPTLLHRRASKRGYAEMNRLLEVTMGLRLPADSEGHAS